MTTVNEALGAPTPLGSDLQEGVRQLSLEQTVTFTKYVKLVMPLDGFVFWVRADLLSPSALFNAARFNRSAFNQSPRIITPAPTATVQGSLHFATSVRQVEDETIAVKNVVFTSTQEVQDLAQIGPTVLFIGEIEGIPFAFSQRGSFYEQARLWHYRGDAVYSDMQSQLVNSLDGFDRLNVVVSNSLPIWLSLNNYQPSGPAYGFGNPVMLYPSYLVPANLPPPYGVVHIEPERTRSLQSAPYIDATGSHWQLASDWVRVTLYGARNFNALNFLDAVNQFSLDYDQIGIMNAPVVRDEKRTQAELQAIAQKKVIEFEVSYYQTTARNVALQLITSAVPNIVVADPATIAA